MPPGNPSIPHWNIAVLVKRTFGRVTEEGGFQSNYGAGRSGITYRQARERPQWVRNFDTRRRGCNDFTDHSLLMTFPWRDVELVASILRARLDPLCRSFLGQFTISAPCFDGVRDGFLEIIFLPALSAAMAMG